MLALKMFRRHPVVPESVPEVRRDWDWTPDQLVLEQYAHQLLFVPDELKVDDLHPSELPDDDPLKGVSCGIINSSCYTHANFLAYERDIGKDKEGRMLKRPIIMPGDFEPSGGFINRPPPPAKVRGELHLVWANRLYLLDKYKENGVKFVRHRIKFNYPWRYVTHHVDSKLPYISHHCFTTKVAWMYVGVPKYWGPLVGGILAKPMQLHEHEGKPRPWIGEYYDFKDH